ncbi:MAG: hypothetical protein ACKOTA_03740, partial [Solirubrobacterales bacterium]
ISWLWWQCRRDRLIRDEVSTDEVRRLTRRLNPGIAAYAVAILARLERLEGDRAVELHVVGQAGAHRL